jgi:hypothetical protein
MATRNENIRYYTYLNDKQVGNTINSLYNHSKKLKNEIRRLEIGSEQWVNKMKELDQVNKTIRPLNERLRGTDSMINKLKGTAMRLLPVFSFAAITAGFARLSKSILGTATDMQLIQRRAEIVFGDSFKMVENTAERVAAKMGLTNNEFIKAASSTADLLVPLDFTREASANLSVELQSLAGALDEWSGGRLGAAGVSEILTKAMLGETEQLKQLGVAIRKDSEEYTSLVKLKLQDGNVTEAQAEALAMFELIQKKTVDAQTAYADSTTNLLRIKKAFNLQIRRATEFLSSFLTPAKSATQLFKEQQSTVNGLQKSISPLLEEYNNLTNKTDLTAIEQERLKTVIKEIGKIAPETITQMDKYGTVLGISATKTQDLIDRQKELLKKLNKDAIEEQERILESLLKQIDAVDNKLAKGTKMVGVGGAGPYQKAIDVPLTPEEIAETNIRKQELGKQLKATEDYLAQLKGEDPFKLPPNEDLNQTITTIATLKEELKGLKEAREGIAAADKEALAANMALIEAKEREIKVLEDYGKTPDVKKDKDAPAGNIPFDMGPFPMDPETQRFVEEGYKAHLDRMKNIQDEIYYMQLDEQGQEVFDTEAKYEQLLNQLDFFHSEGIIKKEEYDRLKEELEQLHADEMLRISGEYETKRQDQQELSLKYQADMNQKTAMAIMGTFGNMAGSMAAMYDKQSGEYKALMAFEATMSTLAAGISAYKSAAEIPTVGWLLGPIAAASAVLYGFAQVGKIYATPKPSFKSQYKFGGPTLPYKHQAQLAEAGQEYVIPTWLRQDPEVAAYENVIEAKRSTGPQAVSTAAPAASRQAPGDSSRDMVSALEKNNELLEKLNQNGVKGVWEWDSYKRGHDEMTAVEEEGRLED